MPVVSHALKIEYFQSPCISKMRITIPSAYFIKPFWTTRKH